VEGNDGRRRAFRDDSSNNRAFLRVRISATNNGASIYLEAKKKPTRTLPRAASDEGRHPPCEDPKGPGGQFALGGGFTDMLMGYSKNQKSAKISCDGSTRDPCSRNGSPATGLYQCATMEWRRIRCGASIRCCAPFKDLPRIGRLEGFCEARTAKAAEVKTKYIIVDMYAKAIQGTPAERRVKWAHDELVKIYA